MLDDMAEPGAARALRVLFIEPSDEAARLAVGAAVLLKRRNQLDQPRVEVRQLAGGILLQLFQIDSETNDWPVAIRAGATINAGFDNAHGILLVGIVSRDSTTCSAGGCTAPRQLALTPTPLPLRRERGVESPGSPRLP